MSVSVDFYLLKDISASAAALLACRLAEKAYLNANNTYIYCDNQQNASAIDQLLWTFKDDSFIPHALANTPTATEAPIVIGCDLTAEKRHYAILINLNPAVHPQSQKFNRILDIVANEALLKEQGRERYKYYREAHYSINLHELS